MINNSIDQDLDTGIKELIVELWKSKILILSITSFLTIVSLVYALSLPNIYQSSATLKIAEEESSSGAMSGLAAQYGATAALAGFALPSGGSKKPFYAIETIKSRDFLNHLLSFNEILPKLMATDSYDPLSKKIIFNSDKYNSVSMQWVGVSEKNKLPSSLDVYKIYRNNLNINLDKLTGFITINYEHLSPKFAKEFIDLIVRELNIVTKNIALVEAEASMIYLEKYLTTTYQREIKDSINALIEAQLKSKMYASTREEFLLKVIDSPFIPEEKSSPSRSLILVLGFLLGGILSFLIVILRIARNKN